MTSNPIPASAPPSPASLLPPELLTQLFHSLTALDPHGEYTTHASLRSLRSRLLYSTLHVCRSWYLSVLPLLYHDIALEMHDPRWSGKVLRSLQEGGKGQMVRSLEVDDVPDWVRHTASCEAEQWDLPAGSMFDSPLHPPPFDDPTPLADEPPQSPLRITLHALSLCPRLRTLILTLRTYPSPGSFSALCSSLCALEQLESLELRCKEQSRFRPALDGAALFTPSRIAELVLPLSQLRRLTIRPVSHSSTSTSPLPSPGVLATPLPRTHKLTHLTVQGSLYTVDLLALLTPFRALTKLHVSLTRESCITQQSLADSLHTLRSTIEDFSLTCTGDNLRFSDQPTSATEQGRADGLLPLERVLPELNKLHSLALNVYIPRFRFPANAQPPDSLHPSPSPGTLFGPGVFDRLPGGVRSFVADVSGIGAERVKQFLERCLEDERRAWEGTGPGVGAELEAEVGPNLGKEDEEEERRQEEQEDEQEDERGRRRSEDLPLSLSLTQPSPSSLGEGSLQPHLFPRPPPPSSSHGPRRGQIHLTLAVESTTWRGRHTAREQARGWEAQVLEQWRREERGEDGEGRLRALVEREGGRYVYAEGWTKGEAAVEIDL